MQLKNDILSKDEKITRLGQDFMLKHDRIGIMERNILIKDEYLPSRIKKSQSWRIALYSTYIQKAELERVWKMIVSLTGVSNIVLS